MARVLIIDDEDIVRVTLRQMLEKAGFQVEEAENGVKGLERQRAAPCDLLITDLIMPEKDGVETIIEFRREFPETKIVAISGGGRTKNMDFLKLAEKVGADGVLPKPFRRNELLEVLVKALN